MEDLLRPSEAALHPCYPEPVGIIIIRGLRMQSQGQARGTDRGERTAIEATYRVVTPLFCAGSDRERPEFRLPSFKGVLRFWWRALAWSRCRGDLESLQSEEDDLFGSSRSGQSRVSLRVARSPAPPQPIRSGAVLYQSDRRVVGPGARYLGYGVMEAFGSQNRKTQEGQLIRACLPAPFKVKVRMIARDLCGRRLASLKDALIALGTLGGMGARSRKGYGSLVIHSLSVDGKPQRVPQSVDGLRRTILALRGSVTEATLPEFTALSSDTRHVLLESDRRDPLELLDLVGRELVRFRSWGRDGRILGGSVESERRFRFDHDLMYRTERNAHPQRIAFGLPHNYGRGLSQRVEPFGQLDRRASPLFIHVHECADVPVAVISFLRARFLPEGRSDISVGGKKIQQVPEPQLYRPIHQFLDRLLDPSLRQEPFKNVLEVSS